MPDNSTKFNPSLRIDIPKWINEAYFQKILTKDVPNFRKILRFTTIAASPPGDNCTSLLLRIFMDIELEDGFTQQKSYIMKTMLDDGSGAAFVNTLNIFPKEKYMYDQLIPKLERLYADVGRNVKFAPQCLLAEDGGGLITLVLEDLHTRKFRNINRQKGFSLSQMKRVLEKLAEFHASTAVWEDCNGAYPTEFQKIYLPSNYHRSKSYQARVNSYKRAMTTWGLQDCEQYVKSIPTAEQFVDAAIRCSYTDPNEFKVLNHGDLWSSNVMLNHLPSGEINQLRFVDFQMCKWGSPAQDLWTLIICSADSSVRVKEFDSFVAIYHEHLLQCLKLLGYTKPKPKLRELHVDMLRHGFWGYLATFTHLVMILLPTDKEASLLKLMQAGEEGDRFRMRALTSPLYVRAVKDIFPFLYMRGILDFN